MFASHLWFSVLTFSLTFSSLTFWLSSHLWLFDFLISDFWLSHRSLTFDVWFHNVLAMLISSKAVFQLWQSNHLPWINLLSGQNLWSELWSDYNLYTSEIPPFFSHCSDWPLSLCAAPDVTALVVLDGFVTNAAWRKVSWILCFCFCVHGLTVSRPQEV